jgi:hypothetical protein
MLTRLARVITELSTERKDSTLALSSIEHVLFLDLVLNQALQDTLIDISLLQEHLA